MKRDISLMKDVCVHTLHGFCNDDDDDDDDGSGSSISSSSSSSSSRRDRSEYCCADESGSGLSGLLSSQPNITGTLASKHLMYLIFWAC